ncbi:MULTISPECIES: helix-turn-helix domain-containing protein [Paraburkholderia]|uniref:Helix-turn-helix domain-containing protein n=1 Tax=Paraburkholderia madseniana TaxID=2599607 RepID=A0AAP5B8T8_9BURK|nr:MULTISPECIES: helix-turn-helix domain-containing protein [Paraburkholderia]MCX4145041.1 helix-turn-helix domain-containing protein [Paraburkholderia madseniana]MDN7147993.1 helix-turn-helix domain-containing protein [Paraburkholderia sp. WS6]MDQ6406873.1 helix-turn-helix domain-containing protein [Paraburkholderia madseniana]
MNDIQNVISTRSISPSARLSFWQRQVGSLLTQLECTSASGDNFFGSIKLHSSAPTTLLEIEAASHTIVRAMPRVAQVGEEKIFVCIQIDGTAIVEQDGRQGVLRAGDMTLLDTSRSFRADFPCEMGQLVLQVPRSLFRKQVGAVERLTAMVVPVENPLGKITGEFVQSLARDFERFSPAVVQRLNEQALDMVVMAFMSSVESGQSIKPSVTRSTLAYRGRAFIEANLRNAWLSPAAVAEHLGISKRYLSIIFAADGLSVERFIRARRLQKCARDLKDAGQAIRPVGDIAFAWGFNNLTHFSQSFKATFGKPPREYRQQALSELPQAREPAPLRTSAGGPE